MSTLIPYRGLRIVTPNPTGDGGLAIQDDLKSLVDWSPKSVWAENRGPMISDDQNANFFPGSLWLQTNVSPPRLFVCQSSSPGAAVWQSVLIQVVQDAAPKLGGDLDVNGRAIASASNGHIALMPNGTGKVGVGTTTPSKALLHVRGVVSTAPTDPPGFEALRLESNQGTLNDGAYLTFRNAGGSNDAGAQIGSRVANAGYPTHVWIATSTANTAPAKRFWVTAAGDVFVGPSLGSLGVTGG